MQVHLRRGLPRVASGQPWPPVDEVALEPDPAVTGDLVGAQAAPAPAQPEGVSTPLRRGLPRTPSGQPWPPTDSVAVAADPAVQQVFPAVAEQPAGPLTTVAVRQGLPRTTGAGPFPPVASVDIPEDPAVAVPPLYGAAVQTAEQAPEQVPAVESSPQPAQPERPEPVAQPVPAPTQTPSRRWWAIGGAALLAAFVVAVLVARWFVGTPTGSSFIERYTGQQPLPEGAPVGLPAWLGWSHFFNMLLMALIIKTGMTVRHERKPEAYWAPRKNPKKKISLTLWLHLTIDVLWVALGVAFYIVLFATGQWMRIVPTSWEVIPQAVSAGIQYLSLDWPTENPWVHYNALQELSYFAVVFLAAPLAILSGARMSEWWPKSWTFFSLKAARAIHFPTMLFFVLFTVVHVFLVFTTGLRRNMNAMFAASGDVDPDVYGTSWTGVILFLVAAAVIAVVCRLARPTLVAPVAQATGKVTSR
ncbi:cytochrome b/b6 domain-containing protein [Corynebacterium sp. CCUG 18816]|uniref:cytochrome b/b6 domain-containing protein n=1 Tax=Corynebacterium pseudogenitalium TaxID=38303 RepID=UPI0021097F78|nr:cytochrome b/b6 domain-containing protein [Corynebacterium pseudogenitalium]MCQ4617064.1 cytochrome b/b6 domain-containing protein [Corynebacterium pseudogenitalium]